MKRLLPLIAFLALTLALAVALLGPKSNPALVPQTLPSTPLPTLEGNRMVRLDRLNGEVVVINFFASWCAPCEAEMPELVALKKQFPKVKFYGIAWNDTAATLKPWLKQHGNPYDALLVDSSGRVAIALGIRGIPETFVIDRAGHARFHYDGALNPGARADTFAPLLQQLQAEHAP